VDTRTKIVTAAEADAGIRASGCSARLVSGYFDPLLAAHAERLEELAAPGWLLVAFVRTPPDPLLPARARAELVAAVGAVDLVVIDDGDDETPGRIGAVETIREEAADERRSRQFIDRVRSRY
jgi:hypothetical protein